MSQPQLPFTYTLPTYQPAYYQPRAYGRGRGRGAQTQRASNGGSQPKPVAAAFPAYKTWEHSKKLSILDEILKDKSIKEEVSKKLATTKLSKSVVTSLITPKFAHAGNASTRHLALIAAVLPRTYAGLAGTLSGVSLQRDSPTVNSSVTVTHVHVSSKTVKAGADAVHHSKPTGTFLISETDADIRSTKTRRAIEALLTISTKGVSSITTSMPVDATADFIRTLCLSKNATTPEISRISAVCTAITDELGIQDQRTFEVELETQLRSLRSEVDYYKRKAEDAAKEHRAGGQTLYPNGPNPPPGASEPGTSLKSTPSS